MSELRSALDEVAALDFAELPDGLLEEEFAELQHAMRILEAQHLRCLAEIDRRASFQADGYLSTASWLRHRFRGGAGSARDQVRTARALGDMPQTREAFASGEVSHDAVRLLASAHDTDPDIFADHEPVLLEAGLGLRDGRGAASMGPTTSPRLPAAGRDGSGRWGSGSGHWRNAHYSLAGGVGCGRPGSGRGRHQNSGATTRRCPGGSVPTVARSFGPTGRGR